MFNVILSVFNNVINNPELLRCKNDKRDLYNPSLEVKRQENEIRYMMDQSNLQFHPIKKVVISCAGDKFDCCEDDFSNATEALIEYFSAFDKLDNFYYDLLFETVEKIFINAEGSITIKKSTLRKENLIMQAVRTVTKIEANPLLTTRKINDKTSGSFFFTTQRII